LDTDEQKEYLLNHPDEYLAYRKMIEGEINQRFHLIVQGTPEAAEARNYSIGEMTRKLASKPNLTASIIPKDFSVGCRRPTPGTEGYLEAISGDKVTIYTKPIVKITETGFVATESNGQEIEVDVIICATGFDTSFCPSFDLKVNGKLINNTLFRSSEKTLSYLSLALPEVPNYMTFCGPFGPFGPRLILSLHRSLYQLRPYAHPEITDRTYQISETKTRALCPIPGTGRIISKANSLDGTV
jgi:cation diffusion facilitator CzcD-associated flavoprotein CzcO